MQTHLVENASKNMENVIILIETMESASGEEEWEIKYDHIASYFDKGKREPQKLTIISQDRLEGAHSRSDQGLKSPKP